MSGIGKGNGPLKADRRYAVARTPAQGGGSGTRRPANTAKRTSPRRPRRNPIIAVLVGFVRLIWRILWGIGWRVSFIFALILGGAVLYFYVQLPPVERLLDGRSRGSVTLLDRNDKVFAWRGETFGGQITADTVSPDLLHAVIATEDKRFYSHFGISPRGIASAVRINLSEGRGPLSGNGGSTITQQVAKLLCLGTAYDPTQWKSEAEYEADCRQGGVWRKIKEIPYAWRWKPSIPRLKS